jgi:hypothetical protein
MNFIDLYISTKAGQVKISPTNVSSFDLYFIMYLSVCRRNYFAHQKDKIDIVHTVPDINVIVHSLNDI